MMSAKEHAEYHIKYYDEGIVVYSNSNIPVTAISGLGNLVPGPESEKIIAMGLHNYLKKTLGADIVYAIAQNEKTLLAWEKRIEQEISRMKNLSVLERWEIGLDTGTSARTMVQAAFPDQKVAFEFGIPHDADDFGRCMRAVDYFTSAMGKEDPGIRGRFLDPSNYHDKGHEWTKILAKWDELCAVARKAGLSKRRGQFSNKHCEILHEMLRQIEYSTL